MIVRKFFDLQRFAVIGNQDYNRSLFGTDLDDVIQNFGRFVNITAGAGNDFIHSGAGIVTINGGTGNDTIGHTGGESVLIYGGEGDDSLGVSGGSAVLIYGNIGNDSLGASGRIKNVTLVGGEGENTFIFDYLVDDSDATIIDYHSGEKIQLLHKSARKWIQNKTSKIEKIDGDVVIRFPTKNGEDQSKVIFKNATDKIFTFVDSEGKVLFQGNIFSEQGENSSTNSDNNYTSIYSTLSDSEKNQLVQSSFQELDKLLHIADNSGIDLTKEDFQDSSLYEKAKNWTTLAKFVGRAIKHVTGGEFLDAFFTFLSGVDEASFYGKEFLDKSRVDISTFSIAEYGAKALSKAITAVDSIIKFFDKIENLDEVADKFPFPFSVCASLVGLLSNIVGVAKDGGFNLKNTIELEKGSAKLINSIIKTASATSPKPLGPLAAGVALTTGVIAGVTQGIFSFKQYEHDKIPTALKNALTDAVTTGIHEAASSFTLGADDAVFEVLTSFAEWLFGKDASDVDMNYMEWIGWAAKLCWWGENHGTGDDDGMQTVAEKTKVVAGAGNDFIQKEHSKVVIYGGVGNDTVIGYKTQGTFENHIDLGDGDDVARIFDVNSTIDGGDGNDTIFASGIKQDNFEIKTFWNLILGGKGNDKVYLYCTKDNRVFGGEDDDVIKVTGVQANVADSGATGNEIYGDEGNDIIYLEKAVSSTVRGGVGNDTIGLVNSQKTYIEYKEGDGIDSIIGYGETDSIRLTRVMSGYSTVESGNDVRVKIGGGEIILVDAKGKKINLSADDTPKKEDMNVFDIKQGTIDGINLRVSAGYEGDIWAGDDDNLKNLKVIDAKTNSHGGILAGNSISNSIIGGNGRNSLWGGASGDNTLTGGTARDQFWYGGNGKDIVTNFSAGNGVNNDVVVLFGGELAGVSRSGANVALDMSNGNAINLKTNSSSAEDVIQYSTDGNNIFGAKIGASNKKSLHYDGSANYFQLNGGGTLNVTGAGENNIWLDGSQGQAFSGISNINATGNGKNILAGNGENNSIVSGSGTSSLWGGSGNSADTLVGGSGTDMFWYGKNDGDDIVNNASSSDVMNLYDVNLSDITSAGVSGSKISVTFNTGGHLHIDSAENLSPKFNLADGSWKFNHSSGNWQNA